ncbi:hypothetical protein OIU77_015327 [Salix suchowensis]|uniref:Uncharacterized protein n=1 Tax=Salix suchowensis TaxID=1278906 RepID=A0ABQ8ZGM5_9ROSI|nr:hypothetical protein OIU77_015327 [Salix suchowensis]
MKKAELVFIPTPGISHLVSTVEVAKQLVDRDERLSIIFLIMKLRSDPKVDRFIDSVSTACNRIQFIHLSKLEPDPNQPSNSFISLIESQRPIIKEEVSRLVSRSESIPGSPTLAGFVLDMFCTSMIDVANEFGAPSYIFLTSSAASLGLQFYVQALHDEHKVDPTEFKGSDTELVMPCLANPLPAKLLPSSMLSKEGLPILIIPARRFRETKGIMVNTFEELESHAINSFSNGNTPPVYPVGPLLNLNRDGDRDVESDKLFNSDGNDDIVGAGEIERGVRCLMELDNEKRERLKEMSGKSRKALESGGTSSTWLGRFIQDVVDRQP